jgi:glycosyltransferase involved in cell wall biosynthesis
MMPEKINDRLRVLIAAENASAKFGGEAILPLHYFRLLRRRGIEAWLIVHGRNRAELSALLPGEQGRIFYVPDTWAHRLLHALGRMLPEDVRVCSSGFAMGLISECFLRRMARRLVERHQIDVVHVPIPVSPKLSSLMHGLGAPVIMGPMNGGMSYPPAFRVKQSLLVRAVNRVGRWVAGCANRWMPGKLRADVLLVANERTRKALPRGIRGRVLELVENGVDLSLWQPTERRGSIGTPVRFVFLGRLVEFKAVDLLLEAFARLVRGHNAVLDIVGSGPEERKLADLAERLGVASRVRFHGWLPQAKAGARLRSADVFVLPSLRDCGGAVVLEAMAVGIPVIATAWGGPADYLDSTCGILVAPTAREALVAGLAQAMAGLAANPERRQALGEAGRARVIREFDWERKIDRMLEILRATANGGRAEHPAIGVRERREP